MSAPATTKEERIGIGYLIKNLYDWIIDRLERTGWIEYKINIP